jgi:uncharacterized protein (TIGR00369 family)
MTIPFDYTELEASGWKRLRSAGPFMELTSDVWRRSAATQGEATVTEYGLLTEKKHLNSAGTVHGGFLVTLIDQIISIEAWEAANRKPMATIQLDTHFVGAVRAGEWIVGRATVEQKTRSMVFLSAQFSSAQGIVARAQGIMKLLNKSPQT